MPEQLVRCLPRHRGRGVLMQQPRVRILLAQPAASLHYQMYAAVVTVAMCYGIAYRRTLCVLYTHPALHVPAWVHPYLS
jgi:hypothetical protein